MKKESKKSAKRYCFESDESGHVYCIPLKDKDLFEELLYSEDNGVAFDDKFGGKMLRMNFTNYSFIDLKEIKEE